MPATYLQHLVRLASVSSSRMAQLAQQPGESSPVRLQFFVYPLGQRFTPLHASCIIQRGMSRRLGAARRDRQESSAASAALPPQPEPGLACPGLPRSTPPSALLDRLSSYFSRQKIKCNCSRLSPRRGGAIVARSSPRTPCPRCVTMIFLPNKSSASSPLVPSTSTSSERRNSCKASCPAQGAFELVR